MFEYSLFHNPRLSCDAEFGIACLDFGIHMFRFACRALVANNTNNNNNNHMLDLNRAERQRHTTKADLLTPEGHEGSGSARPVERG